MSNPRSCPFCGLVDDHTDNCYFTLKLEGATIGVIQAAWNRRAPVLTPQQSAQRASVDTQEFRNLLGDLLDAHRKEMQGGPATAYEKARPKFIPHINAWGSAGSGAPADPMDWPIPCDIKTGACTIRKGCSLRTVVARMESLHRMATAALPKLSPEEREANWKALQDAAAPSPAPQGEQA